MSFRLVKCVGFIRFVEGESLFVNERFEFAVVDECGDLAKDLALSLAPHPGEQGKGHVFNMKGEAS